MLAARTRLVTALTHRISLTAAKSSKYSWLQTSQTSAKSCCNVLWTESFLRSLSSFKFRFCFIKWAKLSDFSISSFLPIVTMSVQTAVIPKYYLPQHLPLSYIWLVKVMLHGTIPDDSQRRCLAQNCVAMLERCYNHSTQCRNNLV